MPTKVCDECEALRDRLCAKWLGADADSPDSRAGWTPKCDVVVHLTPASYVQAVGAPGAATVASSLVDQEKGQIRIRRIDVRGQDPKWQDTALPHELTHVVLADRFAGKRLPRWADEGVATLADPASKQEGHLRDMRQAMSTRSGFRVVELLNMDDYPPAHRWAAFYGQSVSITKFLVERGRSDQFVNFVDVAMERGYENALRDVYKINGTAELERAWMAQINSPIENSGKTAVSSVEIDGSTVTQQTANSSSQALAPIESLALAGQRSAEPLPREANQLSSLSP
jgi:hypothetical protein